jgi:hypothetical protein
VETSGGRRLAKLSAITEKYIILCEGIHDAEFFRHLIQLNGFQDFQICSVEYVLGEKHGGNTKFTDALDELVALPGFDGLEKILLVSDNDLDPTQSFQGIAAAIQATAPIIGPPPRRLIAPAVPLVKVGADPAIIVMMLPWTGQVGSLTTMCLTAATNAQPTNANCVDDLAICTHADMWPVTTLAKMKLRALFASTHRAAPDISPAYVWSRGTNLVPLSDPIFDQVETFLQGFASL